MKPDELEKKKRKKRVPIDADLVFFFFTGHTAQRWSTWDMNKLKEIDKRLEAL